MALRSTYGSGDYASGLYGEPETTQAAASASIGFAASASAVTIVEASASASIALTSSDVSYIIIKDASASVSLGGIANVSAITYEVISGFRAGYGLNTYGSYLYGKTSASKRAARLPASVLRPASMHRQYVSQALRQVLRLYSLRTA